MNAPVTPPGHFQRILFCTDFPEGPDRAFDFALAMARQNPGCTLLLLHVIPETDARFWRAYIDEVEDIDQQARQQIDRKIDTTYRARMPAAIPFEVQFRIGKDYLEILEFMRERQVDLVVIGREGHGALHRAFFGKVAEKVVRKATCPVLVVPIEPARDQTEG